jgi:hypothetical protein
MLLRIEQLEGQVSDLRSRLTYLENHNGAPDPARPVAPPIPERGSRFRRAVRDAERAVEPAHARGSHEGARLVAWHMLQAGTPGETVAAHLEETLEIADADSVVDEVAHYDSRPSEPNQEGK